MNLAEQLTQIPALLAQLSLEPGSAPPDPDAIRGTTNPARPPLRLEVVDLLDRRAKQLSDTPDNHDPNLDKLIGHRRTLGI